MRVFIALELPPSMRAMLENQLEQLQAALPGRGIRWVRPEGIHLTLKFLGNVPTAQLPAIRAGAQAAARDISPFSLQSTHLGGFPSLQNPRVIWLGIAGDLATLDSLQAAVENKLAPLGYPTDTRGFKAHLTLGRIKRAAPQEAQAIGRTLEQQAAGPSVQWRCESLSVMQSILHPSGAEYRALHTIRFGKGE